MAGTSYDIEFRGEAIVNDAINTLLGRPHQRGSGARGNLLQHAAAGPDHGGRDPAFSGDSAGSRWRPPPPGPPAGPADRRRARNPRRSTASSTPVPRRPCGSRGSPGALGPGAPASYADYLLNTVVPRAEVFWGADPTAVDQSCLDPAFAAAHNAVGSHPQICYDTTYTLLNHITTPFFLRMDINDPLAKQKYVDWQLLGGVPAFWLAQDDLLQNVATGPGGLEPWPVQPGAFGPKCNLHVSILNNRFFTHHTNPAGLPFHDLLVNWRDGLLPASQIQVDFNAGAPYTPSICP